MAISGVRVTHPDGSVRDYPAGRGFRFDGYADLVVVDTDGSPVALRKRDTVAEVDLTTD
jgi:hypothetical protein